MKTLFVMRHAKSSWQDASLADFERPLNERGERAAPFMGKFMRKSGFEPSVILSSPAERAKQTAMLAKDAGGFSCELLFDGGIYEASPYRLLKIVTKIDDTYASVMLVGHNPGMESFVRLLTGNLEPMPTAALAVIILKIDKWNKIDDACGKLQAVYRPKDLIRV